MPTENDDYLIDDLVLDEPVFHECNKAESRQLDKRDIHIDLDSRNQPSTSGLEKFPEPHQNKRLIRTPKRFNVSSDKDDLPLSELNSARNKDDENEEDENLCTICKCDYRH